MALQAGIDALPLPSFAALPESMLCCICQQACADNVTLCKQSHNACRLCANRILEHAGPSSRKCPVGCADLHRPDGQWMRNTPLNSLITDMQVKCPYVESGCAHECKVLDMGQHTGACGYRKTVCDVPGCTWTGCFNQLAEHKRDDDHGKNLVAVMLDLRQSMRLYHEAVGGFKDELSGLSGRMDTMQSQLNAIGSVQNNQYATLQAIEGKVKWKDGSSARSERRDRAGGKKIKELEEEAAAVSRATEEKERQHTEQVSSLEGSLERERKRPRHDAIAEYRLSSMVHDQHKLLSSMLPHATPRACPCDACREATAAARGVNP